MNLLCQQVSLQQNLQIREEINRIIFDLQNDQKLLSEVIQLPQSTLEEMQNKNTNLKQLVIKYGHNNIIKSDFDQQIESRLDMLSKGTVNDISIQLR